MEFNLKRYDSIKLFLLFFITPYLIQYVAAITPGIKDYLLTYHLYVLSFIPFPTYFNFRTMSFFLIALGVVLLPPLLLNFIIFINKLTKLVAFILLPIVGLYMLLSYRSNSDPYLLLLTIYYWSILIALVPVLIVNFWPEENKYSTIKRAIIIAVILSLGFMSLNLFFSRDQIAQSAQMSQGRDQELEEYKLKVRASKIEYFPSRVGNKMNEEISDKFPVYEYSSTLTARTYGVRQIYACKGGYETSWDVFSLTEGLESEQSYSLEEVYAAYLKEKNEEFSSKLVVEKVPIDNGQGVFIMSQMRGASDGIWGELYFTRGDKRVQIVLSEECVQDVSNIKAETIKIANTIN